MSDDPAIALVTDSTASLTPEDRERLRIEVVNLYVIMNGEQRPENEITDYDTFYKSVLESEQLTTTSQ
ncbi:MAG: DegV family protein, partial [Actinomycetota bacterium]|nr:DegV family protein [Actinomycetota bacterium]